MANANSSRSIPRSTAKNSEYSTSIGTIHTPCYKTFKIYFTPKSATVPQRDQTMNEIPLSTLANIAEIIGAGSIITGLIFGWFQVRHLRSQQRDTVAINLMQTFYNRELAQAVSLLQTLPDGVSLNEVKAAGNEYVTAAVTVVTTFETMGLLVYKRIAPMDLVLDLAGGMVTTMNRKLRVWQNDMRESQNQPSWGEWFEWLGDQAEKAEGDMTPAHVRHRDWAY